MGSRAGRRVKAKARSPAFSCSYMSKLKRPFFLKGASCSRSLGAADTVVPPSGELQTTPCILSLPEDLKAAAKLMGLSSLKEPSETGLKEGAYTPLFWEPD